MAKSILELQQVLEQARLNYERQWELYPNFDEESKQKRMELALQLVDAEEDLKDAEYEIRRQEREQKWQEKREQIKREFQAFIAS